MSIVDGLDVISMGLWKSERKVIVKTWITVGRTREKDIPMIRRLQPETKVHYKAIFAVLNSLPMGERLLEGFSYMPCAYQIE